MSGYADYYQRAIDGGQPGVKLVLGPTGLGKTSAIPAVLRNNLGRKAVYIANRKVLLDHMATEFTEHGFAPEACVMLPRDLDVVQRVLEDPPLRQAYEQLLTDPDFEAYLHSARSTSARRPVTTATIRRAGDMLLDLLKGKKNVLSLPQVVADEADAKAQTVLQACRSVLIHARDRREQSPNYRRLIAHPAIEALFPAIRFRKRAESQILLLTLHKAFYGFFDGKQTRNLTNLSDDSNLIVFLDEFDFLEHDLVKLICRSTQIEDPFNFTAHFHRAMVHHKIPRPDYPVRDKAKAITDYIDKQMRYLGLDYPNINQFTFRPHASNSRKPPAMPAIFRTRHAISTSPLYIHQTERAFQLETQQLDPSWKPANWFFNTIGYATERILTFYKEERERDEGEYRELMRQAFRSTEFMDLIDELASFPSRPKPQFTEAGNLFDGGYTVFDIDDLQQRTDDEEVEVTQLQMLQTPENLLRTLAKRFLVFGLSATADLRRSVHHFDLNWLENEGVLFPILEEDRADIQRMSQQKAKRRGNHLRIERIDQLEANDPVQAQLASFLEVIVRSPEFDDDRGGHRSQRMHRFFAALFSLLAQPDERPRSLLFLTSFKQVLLALTTFAPYATEQGVYTVEPISEHGKWFQAFNLTLAGRTLTVVFFDAEVTNQQRRDPLAIGAFRELFWRPHPVVVVTQYQSAGNGVNLQFTDGPEASKRDFTQIGLLEAPYFFFNVPDPMQQTQDDIFAATKENIWYLAKLYTAKYLAEKQFRDMLSTINRPREWNDRYRQGAPQTDWRLNLLAIFIQALGRIEREWTPSADQVALLAPEVFETFQVFAGSEYDILREEHDAFASANLRAVIHEVAAQTKQIEREGRRRRDTRLREANERSKTAVHGLLDRLEQLRHDGQDLQARRDWKDLRRAVLRHDAHAEIVRRYDCAASSPYYSRGRLTLSQKFDILPPGLQEPGSRTVHMDLLYTQVRHNPEVRQHFEQHGYELSFDHADHTFFTPYCLQAILAGAIGEEAITALLAHRSIDVEELPDTLFELADLAISGRPWFIDCKNYSDRTLENFTLSSDDPAWSVKLNEEYFRQHAQEKLNRIQTYTRADSKLIYINVASGQERQLGYFTQQFERAKTFDEAAIIVVQGALDREEPSRLHREFERFLTDLEAALGSTMGNATENETTSLESRPESSEEESR